MSVSPVNSVGEMSDQKKMCLWETNDQKNLCLCWKFIDHTSYALEMIQGNCPSQVIRRSCVWLLCPAMFYYINRHRLFSIKNLYDYLHIFSSILYNNCKSSAISSLTPFLIVHLSLGHRFCLQKCSTKYCKKSFLWNLILCERNNLKHESCISCTV